MIKTPSRFLQLQKFAVKEVMKQSPNKSWQSLEHINYQTLKTIE